MTLNDMLAACNFASVKDRAMLLDELHRAGRLEEEALVGAAGLHIIWDKRWALAVTPLEWDRGHVCPFCRFPAPVGHGPFCSHVIWSSWMGDALTPCVAEFVEEAQCPLIPAMVRALPLMESPVLPLWVDGDGTTCRPQMMTPDGARRPAIICAPRPRLYLARLLNLVRQREAAGCPIRVPDPEADGADEPA